MNQQLVRCLILACGNTLREDDGVGPWLAQWAEERFRDEPGVRVISSQQLTPEMAEDVSRAAAVIFIDCAADASPGAVQLVSVEPRAGNEGLATHHLDAAQLLSLSREFYGVVPRSSMLLTVGAASLELREGLSDVVKEVLPEACAVLEAAIHRQLMKPDQRA